MSNAQFLTDNDAYVDIDMILDRYRRSRTKILLLVGAIAFIFFGTISGYTALQISTARLNHLTSTTVELATVTVGSEKCISNPGDKVCVTAKEIVADPEKAKNMPPVNSTGPVFASTYDFHTDPMTSLFAVVLTQPLILRLQ